MSELLRWEECLEKIQALAFRDPEVIEAVQWSRLREHLRYVGEHSPYYREVFRNAGITPDAVTCLDDFQRLPLTRKEDLARGAEQFLAVSEEEVRDVCQTSGTTGEPVCLYQTGSDLERLGLNEALAFGGGGVTAADRMLIVCAMDRSFMAGLAYFLGAQRIGATALRTGSSSLAHVIQTLKLCPPTVMVGVPGMLIALAERCLDQGLRPAELGIRKIFCIGEPIRNDDFSLNLSGQRLQELWGCELFATYASTEMATTFCECERGCGGHLQPWLMVLELVDEDGNVLNEDGAVGEVVATPLGVRGMPLVRFATGDIARLHLKPCACGRRTPRLGPILGRKQQMLKVRGCSFYPPAVATALQELPGVGLWYLEVRDAVDHDGDQVTLVLAESPDLPAPDAIQAHIAGRIRVRLDIGIRPALEVQKRVHDPAYRKPRTWFDFRQRSC
ncbi:MAG: phenylacetate--CoA ligase family protein [Lentisphaerae bacterium]|nr:MAG: phenylacetate--CoA ligase family protein [Lentisphaerota bacterium]